jgi:hypothetical protein
MKVWFSKYAITLGVQEREVHDLRDGWVRVLPYFNSFKMGRDVHDTPEAAIAAAEVDRVNRIASLRRQIEKLESMSFVSTQPK